MSGKKGGKYIKGLKVDVCKNCGEAIISKDGKKWVHGTVSGFSELRLIYSPCEKAEPSQYGKTFIIAYESGLGKGWTIIEGAVDANSALEGFREKEPEIFKLCQKHGTILVAREEGQEGQELKNDTFIEWLSKQKDRKDDLGDLVRKFLIDKNIKSWYDFRDHLEKLGATAEEMKTCENSWVEFTTQRIERL